MGLLKALILAVSVATVTRAGLAYLPITGPSPLRIHMVKIAPPTPVEKFVAVAGKVLSDTNLNNLIPLSLADAHTLAANSVGADTNLIRALAPVSIGAGNTPDDPFGTTMFALPTPELMGITPQMLALYFHPAGNGTNAAALVGPLHVGFVPPLPPAEKSSKAEYIVK